MLMQHIFVSVIAKGQVDFKSPYTAAHQPAIKECFMIVQGDDNGPQVLMELDGPSATNLNHYSEYVARGYTVVGHSVEYHHGHLRATMIPMGIDPRDGLTKTICTMLGLTGHVQKRNGRRGWPSFDESCEHFGITRAGKETAEDNARCLAQMFQSMIRAGIEPDTRTWKER